jgi:hypothetical protein
MSTTSPGGKPFEIGLVMAGAISAGAYTAGVIDFLIEALEEWQKEKDRNPETTSRHDVRIKVMSGASAGGMTSAITAATLNGDHEPVTTLPDGSIPEHNKLYSSWVEQIDIIELLRDQDLTRYRPARSVLDSTVLDDIADNAISFVPKAPRRPYLADDLHLYLTLANLRGVPYKIAFRGQTDYGYEMSMHADNLHFVSAEQDPKLSGVRWLNPADPGQDNWQTLKQAALATGAFPLGLAPRLLHRPADDYTNLLWDIPAGTAQDNCVCYDQKPIPPFWPPDFKDDPEYEFISVDGGLMNNEPFELARRCLSGGLAGNPRTPQEVHRVVIMIDPFPTEEPLTREDVAKYPDYDLLDVFMGMFSSLKSQARFKPEDLELAQDPSIYSRWLIAPIREENGTRADHPIACGSVGGFGGFLSVKFRRHDYQLGRRNCQKFLRDWFVIPLEDAKLNEVFNFQDLEALKVTRAGREGSFIPIIPLFGTCTQEIEALPWETIDNDRLETIRGLLNSRLEKVIHRLLETRVTGWGGVIGDVASFMLHGKLTDFIMAKIRSDLENCGLVENEKTTDTWISEASR